MTGISRMAMAMALTTALGVGVVATPEAWAQRAKKEKAAEAPRLSADVLKALGPASKKGEPAAIEAEMAAKNYPAALARIRTAEAVPNRNALDNHTLAVFKVQIAQASQDDALLKEGIEGAMAAGQLTAEQRPQFQRNLAALAVRRNDWADAERQYLALAELAPNDATVVTDLAKIYVRNKQPAKAIATFRRAVAASEAAGIKPEEGLYGSQLQLAYDNRLTAEIEPAAKALVTAYPSGRNWNAALFALRGNAKFDDQADLDLLRLLRATGGLTGEGEYLDYASTAQLRGLPGEAKTVLDEGIAKGVVDAAKPNVKELRGLVPAAKVTADKASLAALEREGRAAKTGRGARATADGYLSHGEWAKAAELYRLALTKGGEDAAVVNTRLGIALARSGDKAGAKAAFAAVQGGSRQSLAQYWMIWTDQQA